MKIGDHLIAIQDINKIVYSVNYLNNIIKDYKIIGNINIKNGEKVLITNITDIGVEIYNNNVNVVFSLTENDNKNEYYKLYFKECDRLEKLKKIKRIQKIQNLKNIFSKIS